MAEWVRNADLCAFMDGECLPAARERVEARLANAPQAAERLALWRRNDAALRMAICGTPGGVVPREEPPAPVLQVKARRADDEPLRAEEHAGPLGRNARAAVIAAFAGGAGAGALALAVLLLAAR